MTTSAGATTVGDFPQNAASEHMLDQQLANYSEMETNNHTHELQIE